MSEKKTISAPKKLGDLVKKSYFLPIALLAMTGMLSLFNLFHVYYRSTNVVSTVVEEQELINTINSELAKAYSSVRGWNNIKKEQYRREFNTSWENGIFPALEQIRNFKGDAQTKDFSIEIEKLKNILFKIHSLQVYIMDISHIPGNYPFRHFYFSRLKFLSEMQYQLATDLLILEEKRPAFDRNAKQYLKRLADLRAAILHLQFRVANFLAWPTKPEKKEILREMNVLEVKLDELNAIDTPTLALDITLNKLKKLIKVYNNSVKNDIFANYPEFQNIALHLVDGELANHHDNAMKLISILRRELDLYIQRSRALLSQLYWFYLVFFVSMMTFLGISIQKLMKKYVLSISDAIIRLSEAAKKFTKDRSIPSLENTSEILEIYELGNCMTKMTEELSVSEKKLQKELDINKKQKIKLKETNKYLASTTSSLQKQISKTAKAIEEKEQSQLFAIQSSRMAALGEMAGGIAHEINNPITVIKLRANHIMQEIQTGSTNSKKIMELATEIRVTTKRIQDIVTSLRVISRNGQGLEMRPVLIRDIINSILPLVEQKFLDNAIELKIYNESSDCLLVCNQIQISQILMNLLINAFKAVKNCQEKWVHLRVYDSGRNFCFEIKDSGQGIPPENISKIFDPFYTTNQIGEGTGLGLSLALSMAKANGGDLVFDQNAKNTLFILSIPKPSELPKLDNENKKSA